MATTEEYKTAEQKAAQTPSTSEDYLRQMYGKQMESQTAQYKQNYEQGLSDLERQQEAARKQTDSNLSRTYAEAEKARKNYNEVQNAYGLTSGAMAQARLAQDNQLQADMTAIRTAQQEADASIERERGLLAKEFANAIAKAQANNDMQLAQALYAQAQREEERLLKNQENAAALMAGAGDYSLYAQLYGLTPEQLAMLQKQNRGGGGGGGYVPIPAEEEILEEEGPGAGKPGLPKTDKRQEESKKLLPIYYGQLG